jgi:hypothetical protein
MTKFHLYEISTFLQDAIDAADSVIDHETGIIPDDWAKFLDDVQGERDKKLLDCGRYEKSLIAEADAIRAEEKNLAARRHILENKAERFKTYMALALKPGEKLSDANTVLTWRKSTRLEIVDEAKVPEQFWKIERSIIKSELKDALKTGHADYARLVECQNLQIR